MSKTLTSVRKSGRKQALRALGYVRRKLSRLTYVLFYVRRDMKLIEESGLFDREWYVQRYPDVAELKMDPIEHYLRHGAAEGRDPNPEFSTWGYAESYADVAAHGINPFIHYVKYGRAEGRALFRKDYAAWIEEYDRLSDDDRLVFRREIDRLQSPPLISILMPVYNTKREYLE